ncbi:unnamed protein product [Parascedosporium putredinis]|uniref:Peroxin/Ferlin domain-containing protein n=1 Tax=Parascedosporium putredinis TaxID=1442378 RepID=A0A9P1H0J7_9PEZI|nr:unnamed protein product [Parascedosporium putredinis]CAI7992202.1 unnamed protein product [Parascedosporium putredinis]
MTSPKRGPDADGGLGPATPDDIASPLPNAPPTYAAFSPATLSSNPAAKSSSKRRSTILSFVMLLVFWAVVLYGDTVIRMAGPIVVVVALILGMYGRRFSPLSTSGWNEPAQKDSSAAAGSAAPTGRLQKNGGKPAANGGAAKLGHTRGNSEVTNTRHQKTLDEIVETLKEFTGRCNMLLEPMIEMTDFLSTQQTPTSATTRPALTTMFIRILFCTPFWIALTLPPLRIITTRRVMLVFGTLILSWHARFMRVAREVLWRSSMVRRLAALLTGKDAGVKFTFIIFENQRRWVGLGWTTSLFAYERSAWTDEHNNSVPSRDSFELPETDEGSLMHWRWVRGSKWKVDGVPDEGKEAVDYDGDEGKNGWVYYDNKWQNGYHLQQPSHHPASDNNDNPADDYDNNGTGQTTKDPGLQHYGEMMVSPMASEFGKASSSSFTSTAATLTPVQETDGAADAESDATATANGEAHHANGISIAHGGNAKRGGEDGKETSDTSSLHSTSSSSRSFFRPGSLRRKITDRSSTSAVSSTTVTSSSSAPPAPGAHSAGRDGRTQQRARRPSEARSETRGEEEVSGLGTAVDIAIHDEGKGSWGIGDEARMSLE